jgi:hypothetical protein
MHREQAFAGDGVWGRDRGGTEPRVVTGMATNHGA